MRKSNTLSIKEADMNSIADETVIIQTSLFGSKHAVSQTGTREGEREYEYTPSLSFWGHIAWGRLQERMDRQGPQSRGSWVRSPAGARPPGKPVLSHPGAYGSSRGQSDAASGNAGPRHQLPAPCFACQRSCHA